MCPLARAQTLPKIFLLLLSIRAYLEGKEFAPPGEQTLSFLSRPSFYVGPLSNGIKCQVKGSGSHRSYLTCEIWLKIYHVYLFPLIKVMYERHLFVHLLSGTNLSDIKEKDLPLSNFSFT